MPEELPPCPCCAQPMHSREAQGVSMHGCGTCGGVWLGVMGSRSLSAGELPRSLLPLARAVHDFARGVVQRGPSYREAPPKIATGPRRCPFCREPLMVSRVFGTEVDVDACAEHGTWFDPTELASLDGHFAKKAIEDQAAVEAYAGLHERTKGWNDRRPVLSVLGVPILWKRKGTAWDMG